MSELDFDGLTFYPVIDLPEKYPIFDFTSGYNPEETIKNKFGVGRYNEVRPTMYQGEQYQNDDGVHRNIHVGIDIAAPVGSEIRAFYSGSILFIQDNNKAWDYGPTIVTEHKILNLKNEVIELYALFGHLSTESLTHLSVGDEFMTGDVLGWIGSSEVNGGWNPHVHFQLSVEKPEQGDMPGVVSQKERQAALKKYPDPRLVLGPIY